MKFFAVGVLVAVCFAVVARSQESEDDENPSNGDSWWSRFKQRVKTVLSKWRDDIRDLWDEVLAKAGGMKSWTQDMFDNFKANMKEWLESLSDVPENEKNEMENFINKLRMPTEEPEGRSKAINP